jgi:hypothetical protein
MLTLDPVDMYQTRLATSPTDLSDGIGQKHHTRPAPRYQVDTSMDSHNHTSGNLLTADGLLLHSYRPLANSTYRSLGHEDQMHNHPLKGRPTNIEVIDAGYGTPVTPTPVMGVTKQNSNRLHNHQSS